MQGHTLWRQWAMLLSRARRRRRSAVVFEHAEPAVTRFSWLLLTCLAGCFSADLETSLNDLDKGRFVGDAGLDPPSRDALVDEPEAGLPSADAMVEESLLRHPACEQGLVLSAPLGARDFTASDASVEPYDLNSWSVLGCDMAVTLQRCDSDTRCPNQQTCLQTALGEQGYCAVASESAPRVRLTFRDGACETEVGPEVKAALCCAGVPGLDCRIWPADQKSGPGQICFDREDCAQGLVCAKRSENSGSCACPFEEQGYVANRPDCIR